HAQRGRAALSQEPGDVPTLLRFHEPGTYERLVNRGAARERLLGDVPPPGDVSPRSLAQRPIALQGTNPPYRRVLRAVDDPVVVVPAGTHEPTLPPAGHAVPWSRWAIVVARLQETRGCPASSGSSASIPRLPIWPSSAGPRRSCAPGSWSA